MCIRDSSSTKPAIKGTSHNKNNRNNVYNVDNSNSSGISDNAGNSDNIATVDVYKRQILLLRQIICQYKYQILICSIV